MSTFQKVRFKFCTALKLLIGLLLFQIKTFITLAVLEACNEFNRPIFTSLRPRNTAPFEEMSQRWRTDNSASGLTGPRFEPKISCSRDKRVTARLTGPPFFNFDASISNSMLQCMIPNPTQFGNHQLAYRKVLLHNN